MMNLGADGSRTRAGIYICSIGCDFTDPLARAYLDLEPRPFDLSAIARVLLWKISRF